MKRILNLFRREKPQYKRLEWMNTTTLDGALTNGMFDSIDGGIVVRKMDVEDFKPNVIVGANAFFESRLASRYIFMEMMSNFMGEATAGRKI